MNIFLTGGSGFLGGRLIARLAQDGHRVRTLARSEQSASQVSDLGAEVVRGDLQDLIVDDPAAWLDVLDDCDAVIHAAAFMEFWGGERIFEERNLRPTVALHRAAVQAGVRRFVLMSAASVSSGTQRANVVDEQTDEGRPNLAYSRVKLATEHALLSAPAGSTETVILRPPFIWGAGMKTLDEIVSAVQGGRFSWIDGGRHTVDFIHVDNLAQATTLALDHGEPGARYYITDGHPLSAREFLGGLLETQGVAPPTRSFPRPAANTVATLMEMTWKLTRRTSPPPLTRWLVAWLGRDRSYDISRARRDLSYEPTVSVAAGMLQMSELNTGAAPGAPSSLG